MLEVGSEDVEHTLLLIIFLFDKYFLNTLIGVDTAPSCKSRKKISRSCILPLSHDLKEEEEQQQQQITLKVRGKEIIKIIVEEFPLWLSG